MTLARAARNANSLDSVRTDAIAAQSHQETLDRRQSIASHQLAGSPAASGSRSGQPSTVRRAQSNQAALRMFSNRASSAGQLHRKCSCGPANSGGGECAECGEQIGRAVDRSAIGKEPANSRVPSIVHQVLRSPGQAIDAGTRTAMETRFGYDFGAVRFHTDSAAIQSAAAVSALAYTVGRHVVFGAGQYSPASDGGRLLIAHELAHVVQQGGGDNVSPQTISDPADAAEREADQAADAAMAVAAAAQSAAPASLSRLAESSGLQPKLPAGGAILQRRIVVDPAGEAGYILGELNTVCPGQLAVSGDTITQSCTASTNQGCNCACDAAGDAARTYTVHVQPAAGRTTTKTLWDGTTQAVPDSTLWPNTSDGNDPDVYVESSGSTIEFGFFRPDGSASWYPHWRILAHELCGHGRLHQTYTGGTGNRPGHDVTIDTENAIAAEHGQPSRGHFADRRQGEAFYNGIGDRSKVVFYQTDGLHYEAP